MKALNSIFVYVAILSIYGFGDKIHGGILSTYLKDSGLTMTLVGSFFGSMGLATSILDLPSGALADKFGRIFSLFVGFVLYGIGLILIPFINDIDGVVMIHVTSGLIGAGVAFASGAGIAWFKSDIGSNSEDLKLGLSYGKTAGWVASAIASVVAFGLIKYVNSDFVFYVGGFTMIVFGVVLKLFTQDNYGDSEKKMHQILLTGIKMFFNNRALIILSIAKTLWLCCFLAFIISWQPYLTEKGVDEQFLPGLFILFMIMAALGSYLFGRYLKVFNLYYVLGIALLIFGGSAITVGLSSNILIIVASMLIFEVMFGISIVSTSIFTTNLVPNRYAATIFSLQSSLECLVGYFLALIIGKIYHETSGSVVFMSFGILPIIVAILLLLFGKMLIVEEKE